jgi:hypothetical protein
MTLKNKVSLLAGAIALAGIAYMPQASAVVVSLGPETSIGLANTGLAQGSFQDWFDFQVSGSAFVAANGNSITFSNSSGTKLESFNLFDGTAHNINATPVVIGAISTPPVGQGPYFASLFTPTPLLENHAYSLEINGTALNNGGSYGASLSTIAAPVPEPEEWAMMLVGGGLVGFQVRRKQKGLSQTSLG